MDDRYLSVGRLVGNTGRPSVAVWSCQECGSLTTNRERHDSVHPEPPGDD